MKNLNLILTSGIYPPDKGGPAFFVSDFSRWLNSKSITTKVVSLKDGPSTKEILSNSEVLLTSRDKLLPFRMLSSIRAIATRARVTKVILMNGLFLEVLIASFFGRSRIVAKIPGDIVWERARNQGKTNLSIDEYQGNERGLKRIFRFFFSQSLKRAEFVIAPSLHLKSLLLNWGIKSERVVLVRNSVDTNFFAPSSDREKKYDVITVCRLVPWKGVEEIIRECARQGLSLAVVGDGPDGQRLKDIASQAHARVDFLGNCPHTELPPLLNSARIFVLNSQYEGSPHSLIEAMSVGLFSIAHASTGSIEVIKDKVNGLLCGQQRSLGEALSLAMIDLDLSRAVSLNARKSALLNFDREKNFEQILRVIEGSL